MGSMAFEIDEILNEAVMTGVPSVIVEGIDDISIYECISKRLPFSVEVYPVEYIDGFGEGSKEVLRAIEEIELVPSSVHRVADHVLGVIDKDVREFRNEMPVSDAVLMLKHYSIESHFASKDVIRFIMTLCTKSTRNMVTDELCDHLIHKVESRLVQLYYFSLDSLKNAVVKGYESDFRYSYGYGRLKDQKIRALIDAKKNDLDLFAVSVNVSCSMTAVKGIARGKWLIEVFAEELLSCIVGLQELCREEVVQSCQCCSGGFFEKCLYRLRDGINKNTIKSLAFSHVEGEEFEYIYERFALLKGSVLVH